MDASAPLLTQWNNSGRLTDYDITQDAARSYRGMQDAVLRHGQHGEADVQPLQPVTCGGAADGPRSELQEQLIARLEGAGIVARGDRSVRFRRRRRHREPCDRAAAKVASSHGPPDFRGRPGRIGRLRVAGRSTVVRNSGPAAIGARHERSIGRAGVVSGKTISNTSIVALGLETAGAAGVVAAGATLAFGASPRAAGIAALIGAAVGGAFGSWLGYEIKSSFPSA